MVKEGNEICDYVEPSVRRRIEWCIGVAVASEIWCDDMVAVGGQELDLVAPSEPGLGEAMEEHDERA